jgi:hypothetical protein
MPFVDLRNPEDNGRGDCLRPCDLRVQQHRGGAPRGQLFPSVSGRQKGADPGKHLRAPMAPWCHPRAGATFEPFAAAGVSAPRCGAGWWELLAGRRGCGGGAVRARARREGELGGRVGVIHLYRPGPTG